MSTPTTTLLHSGDTLGGFRIDDVIGIGGMAIVYRAVQVSLGRPVALKVLSSKLTGDEIFRERFRREGTHAATLEHPNIVPVYDSGEQDGHLYLAMRLIEGTNLAELIQTRGLSANETIETLRPIANALDTAHAAGLIHRDVKPQNILLTPQGHPYLADFGVAKGSNTYGLTATGGFVGSVNYASPEQINGLTLTPASDVYALTAVLYQCLTGQVPYPRETDAGVMHAHLTEPPPSLPMLAGADSGFHSVLARGMAKDAGSRYGHAGDLINAAAIAVGRIPSKLRNSVPAFPVTEDKDHDPRLTASRSLASETEAVARKGREELLRQQEAASATTADRKRASAPATPAAPSRAQRRWRLPAVIVGGLLVLAAGLAAVLTSGSSNAKASTLRTGPLSLTAESSWSRTATGLPGLPLLRPISLSRSGVSFEAGPLASDGTAIAAVPPTLLARDGRPSSSGSTHLPLGLARSYAWQNERAGSLSMLVVATSAGEMVLACHTTATAKATTMPAACAKLAQTVRIDGATVEYPGADPHLASVVSGGLASRDRAVDSTGLDATSLASRAHALDRVAKVDAQAASALRSTVASPRYRTRLTSLAEALARESGAIDRMASAAASDKRGTYEASREQLAAYLSKLRASSNALVALGFSMRPVAALQLAALARPHRRSASASTTPSAHVSAPSATQAPPARAPQTPVAPPTPTYRPPVKSTPQNHSNAAPKTIVSAPS